jgi:hypothetical protein
MGTKLQQRLSSFSLNRINNNRRLPWGYSDAAGLAIIFVLAVSTPFLNGGFDFLTVYRVGTLEGTYGTAVFNPWPIYFLFYPFSILPPRLGYLLWNLAGATCFIYAIHRFKGSYLYFATSLPCVWIFFNGQIEGFITLGLVLATLPNPLLAGLGLTLLSLKPQFGLFVIAFIILHRRDWRILAVPALVYGLSLVLWGWWIPTWFKSVWRQGDNLTSISFYPYGLLFLPLLWSQRNSLKAWIFTEGIAMPYFAVYSLAPLFTTRMPLWISLLIWLQRFSIYTAYPIPTFIVGLLPLVWAYLSPKSDSAYFRHLNLSEGETKLNPKPRTIIL